MERYQALQAACHCVGREILRFVDANPSNFYTMRAWSRVNIETRQVPIMTRQTDSANGARPAVRCVADPIARRIIPRRGDVAQLGERRVRNAKVEGSIPFVSTKFSLTR